jgi:hypothetical protein
VCAASVTAASTATASRSFACPFAFVAAPLLPPLACGLPPLPPVAFAGDGLLSAATKADCTLMISALSPLLPPLLLLSLPSPPLRVLLRLPRLC